MKSTFFTIALAGAAALLLVPSAKAEASAQTIKNLNAAFQGESNAANRYKIFAEKAEKDGFPEAARMFRATSASEAIHRDNHKAAILKLGGKVEPFELEAVTPGTTAENIKTAIKGETYEVDKMYPEFLALAKQEDARPAIGTFNAAMETEKAHAKIYADALENLGKQGVAAVEYFVCQVCGMTVTKLPAKKCPVCREPVSEFKKIS